MRPTTTKKPTKKREPREDFNQAAFRIVQQATGLASKPEANEGVTRKPDRRGIMRKPKGGPELLCRDLRSVMAEPFGCCSAPPAASSR